MSHSESPSCEALSKFAQSDSSPGYIEEYKIGFAEKPLRGYKKSKESKFKGVNTRKGSKKIQECGIMKGAKTGVFSV